ncbi:MAG TPA: tripartite tricarboxylate transporter substrate binding protein [Burkholderiaceae bacterium]|nr:tripartite tricarboxylate transporter substrate binding protein [Burkholderiaceae bacterium]
MSRPLHRRSFVGGLAAGAALGAIPGARALAQSAGSYPTQTVRIVVPVAPGGVTDVAARAIAAQLQQAWSQSVVVENRPGGAGVPGTDFVARARPDGYTLLMGTVGTLTVNGALIRKLPYDTLRDFVPVTMVTAAPNVLLLHPSVPAASVGELIDYARRNPGRLNFGSPGNGSSPHLGGELLKRLANIDMVHVPYSGAGPASVDLFGGQIQMMFDNPVTALPNIRAGRVKALAVTGSKRSPLLPDLPTLIEAGVPGYEIYSWTGMVAPARTPPAELKAISDGVRRVLRLPEVRERLAGTDLVGNSPEEFGEFLRMEIEKWSTVLKAAGIQPE